MRAMLTVAVSLSICAGLTGCDEGHKTPTTAVATAATTPACNCQQQAQVVPPPLERPLLPRHRHHQYTRHREGHYEIGWGESASSVGSYTEASSGTEYEMAGDARDSMGPPESAPYPPPPPSSSSAGPESGPAPDVWVDGYGRGHYAEGEPAPSSDVGAGSLSNEDIGRRHDPWRGYNAKCRNTIE